MKSQKLVQWTGIVALLSSLYGIVIHRVFLIELGLPFYVIAPWPEAPNLLLSTLPLAIPSAICGIIAINYYKEDPRYNKTISVLLILSVLILPNVLRLIGALLCVINLKEFKDSASNTAVTEDPKRIPSYLLLQYRAVSGLIIASSLYSDVMISPIASNFQIFSFYAIPLGCVCYMVWLRAKCHQLSRMSLLLALIGVGVTFLLSGSSLSILILFIAGITGVTQPAYLEDK